MTYKFVTVRINDMPPRPTKEEQDTDLAYAQKEFRLAESAGDLLHYLNLLITELHIPIANGNIDKEIVFTCKSAESLIKRIKEGK
jgi:hypothetical protein